jgi:hypothetical protein
MVPLCLSLPCLQTRPLLNQPDFMTMLQEINRDPSSMNVRLKRTPSPTHSPSNHTGMRISWSTHVFLFMSIIYTACPPHPPTPNSTPRHASSLPTHPLLCLCSAIWRMSAFSSPSKSAWACAWKPQKSPLPQGLLMQAALPLWRQRGRRGMQRQRHPRPQRQVCVGHSATVYPTPPPPPPKTTYAHARTAHSPPFPPLSPPVHCAVAMPTNSGTPHALCQCPFLFPLQALLPRRGLTGVRTVMNGRL